MKQLVYKILLLVIFVGLFSCSKDYLELDDPNAMSSETFWRNLEDCDKGLNAVYGGLMYQHIYNFNIDFLHTDQAWPGWGRPSPSGNLAPFYTLSYNTSHGELYQKWFGAYGAIFRANQVIEGLQKIEANMETEDEIEVWTHMMGQARFARGWMHFFLASTFNRGQIVIRDVVPGSNEEFNTGVSPADEVIDFYRADLKYAYENLPAQYLYDANTVESRNIGRFTKGAAATVLGTSYLYEATEGQNDAPDMALMDSAILYFDDVINNPDYGYRLLNGSEIQDLFTVRGEFNAESIIEISYNLILNTELSQWDDNSQSSRWDKVMYGSTGLFLPVWMVYEYKNEPMDPLDTRNYYSDTSSTTGFSMRNVPLRCSQFATVVEDEQTLYRETTNITNGELFTWDGWGFGRCSKYGSVHEPALENDWRSNKNIVLNRLASVYLMQAECYTRSGQVTEALELINAIRARWGLVLLGPDNGDISRTYDGYNYAANPDSLMDRIMYIESPLELIHEGHATRWINMRRWGITAERYADLASRTYYAVDYSGHNLEGEATDKPKASIVRASDSTFDAGNNVEISYEFDLSSINYNPAIHDYYPIPEIEATANNEID